MPPASSEVQRASEDYWRRYLRRAVAPNPARDARREVKRYPFSMVGQLCFTEGARTRREEFAIIEVSTIGVMGLIKEEVPWQADVCIELNPEGTPFALQGCARHCTSTIGGYKLGVELSFDDRAGGQNAQESRQSEGLEPEA